MKLMIRANDEPTSHLFVEILVDGDFSADKIDETIDSTLASFGCVLEDLKFEQPDKDFDDDENKIRCKIEFVAMSYDRSSLKDALVDSIEDASNAFGSYKVVEIN